MRELNQYFCLNEQCENFGITNQSNISVRSKYGKDKSRILLYCRTCRKTFAATRSCAQYGSHLPSEKIREIIHHASKGLSVRQISCLLHVDKDTVNRVLLKARERCATVLADLLASLEMSETQLNDLWGFIRNRKVLAAMKAASRARKGGMGLEPPQKKDD